MQTVKKAGLVIALGMALAGDASARSGKAPAEKASARSSSPKIEVVFVLDTTGSMGGLIEGAKLKIWSIANQMIAVKPTPVVRIGLIGFRDRGDQYVTRFFDLSEDIDQIYAELQEFRAEGGGDGPESVNQALNEAVTRPSWSKSRDVLKVIFLVGDSPPHMDYAQDVKYPDSCQIAVRRDIIVNTVQCGTNGSTTPVWQEIARLAEGTYVAIGQTGNMRVVSTPMDAELAELNRAVGRTIVAYGSSSTRSEVMLKQATAESAMPAAAADRLTFNIAGGKVVQGHGDLIDDEKAGRVKLEEVKREELPEELKGLSVQEQRKYLAAKRAERDKIQARIAELTKKRQAYIEQETRKAAEEGRGDAFDLKVAEAIRKQAARKGFQHGTGAD